MSSALSHRETHVLQNQSGKIVEISGPLAVIWTLINGKRSIKELARLTDYPLADIAAASESLRLMGMLTK